MRLLTIPTGTGSSWSRTGCRRSRSGSSRLLNGGVEAEIYGLAELGDTITCQARYADIHERGGRSGPMVFVVVQTDYRTTAGRALLRARTTMIAR